MAPAPAPLPPSRTRRAQHLRSVVARQVEESRFRTALTRDLLTGPPPRRRVQV